MNKEEMKNFHYNNKNEIQFEYGGQTHHYSMECLKELIVKYYEQMDKIEEITKNIQTTIEIINEQPSKNIQEDNFILKKLESFIKILKGDKQ